MQDTESCSDIQDRGTHAWFGAELDGSTQSFAMILAYR
jgi:hypothetical protein